MKILKMIYLINRLIVLSGNSFLGINGIPLGLWESMGTPLEPVGSAGSVLGVPGGLGVLGQFRAPMGRYQETKNQTSDHMTICSGISLVQDCIPSTQNYGNNYGDFPVKYIIILL